MWEGDIIKIELLMKKFLTNVGELNSNFKIYPLLYGSLGLQQLLSDNLNRDDIDNLITEIFLKEKWDEFRNYLTSKGYVMIDLQEHTFFKDDTLFSYACIEGLEEFAGIKLGEINLMSANNKSYLVLNLEQYLQVYKQSCLDGYRINKKEKKDYEKIYLIEQAIRKNKIWEFLLISYQI